MSQGKLNHSVDVGASFVGQRLPLRFRNPSVHLVHEVCKGRRPVLPDSLMDIERIRHSRLRSGAQGSQKPRGSMRSMTCPFVSTTFTFFAKFVCAAKNACKPCFSGDHSSRTTAFGFFFLLATSPARCFSQSFLRSTSISVMGYVR